MRMDDNRKENSEAQGRKESSEAASDFEFLQEKIKAVSYTHLTLPTIRLV